MSSQTGTCRAGVEVDVSAVAGLGRANERYYGFLPVHPALLAATFRVAGLGLFQLRLETVILGAAALLLTLLTTLLLRAQAAEIPALGVRAIQPVPGMPPVRALFPSSARGFFLTSGTSAVYC